jgi:DNA-binding MarR family transcriptional regulator
VDHRTPAGERAATDDVDGIELAWQRERPGTPVASIGVLTRIRRIGRLLENDRRRTLARLGIDPATLDLLSTLRRAGPPYQLTPGQLARRSLVSAGAITQRVARAQRAGLVRRGTSGQDGRSVLVSLAPDGHALVERSVDELLRHEESLLGSLSARERTQLADLLRVLLAGLTG